MQIHMLVLTHTHASQATKTEVFPFRRPTNNKIMVRHQLFTQMGKSFLSIFLLV
jgi:hypothetical protein